jgi:hypothetical protein
MIMAMYDNENTVRGSFDLNYVSEYLIQAQWAEFIELKKAIHEVATRKKLRNYTRYWNRQCKNTQTFERNKGHLEEVAFYDGTDNAMSCVEISKNEIKRLNIEDKVAVHFFDAVNLDKWTKKHDIVITTWFTAGNFNPDDFSFDTYKNSDKRLDLTTNKKFSSVFSKAYDLLNPMGKL